MLSLQDIPVLYEEEGDDTAIFGFFMELLEIILRAYGPRSAWGQDGKCLRLSSEAVGLYQSMHNRVQLLKKEPSFPDDVKANFAKLGQWSPSYCFASHALNEAIKYGKFRRAAGDNLNEYSPPHRRACIPRDIPNLLDPAFGESFSHLGPDSVRKAMRFLTTLQFGVHVLACEAWCL